MVGIFSRSSLVFDIFFDGVNNSRITPYGGFGWGRSTSNVSNIARESYNIWSKGGYTFIEGTTPYRHFSYGLTIGLGEHPTPSEKLRSEFELGIRHSNGGSIVDGERSFHYSGGTTVTWGFRFTSGTGKRWAWWLD